MSQGNKWPPRGQQSSLSQSHSGCPVVEKRFLVCLPPALRSSGKSPGCPDLGIWSGGPRAEPVQLLQSGSDNLTPLSFRARVGVPSEGLRNSDRACQHRRQEGCSPKECCPMCDFEGREATILNTTWNVYGMYTQSPSQTSPSDPLPLSPRKASKPCP